MGGSTEPTTVAPTSSRRASELVDGYRHELEASYGSWVSVLNTIRTASNVPEMPDPAPSTTLTDAQVKIDSLRKYSDMLRERLVQIGSDVGRLQRTVSDVSTFGDELNENMRAKQQEADLRVKVVSAFPPDKLSELTGTIAAVLVGGARRPTSWSTAPYQQGFCGGLLRPRLSLQSCRALNIRPPSGRSSNHD